MEKMVLGIPCVQKRRLLDQTAQGLEAIVEKVAKRCKSCEHDCKQPANISVVQCPLYKKADK